MKFPNDPVERHFAASDQAIELARKNLITQYVRSITVRRMPLLVDPPLLVEIHRRPSCAPKLGPLTSVRWLTIRLSRRAEYDRRRLSFVWARTTALPKQTKARANAKRTAERPIRLASSRQVRRAPCARHRRQGRTGVPTYPDAPNIAVLPNHVTMPIGVAIVESQIEFLRKFGEGGRFETDTCTQCVQVFDGAVVPSIRMLSQDLGWLRHFRSRESPTFNHVNSPPSQIAQNFLQFC
jgi:hypothetical protein